MGTVSVQNSMQINLGGDSGEKIVEGRSFRVGIATRQIYPGGQCLFT